MAEIQDATMKKVGDETGSAATDAASKDASASGQQKDLDLDKGSKATELKGEKAKEFVEDILDEYGLESADDLKTFMANLNELRGKIGDQDLDQILANSKTLETYQAHWAKQERERLKESETPEQTIARLEKENQDLATEKSKAKDQQKAARAAEAALENFNDTVMSIISAESGGVVKEYQPFLAEFLGVNNPINEVNIEDKAAVRKLSKDAVKKLEKFEQVVIKRYLDGKIKIPKVTASTAGGETLDTDKGPKNLKEARGILRESLRAIVGKK